MAHLRVETSLAINRSETCLLKLGIMLTEVTFQPPNQQLLTPWRLEIMEIRGQSNMVT